MRRHWRHCTVCCGWHQRKCGGVGGSTCMCDVQIDHLTQTVHKRIPPFEERFCHALTNQQEIILYWNYTSGRIRELNNCGVPLFFHRRIGTYIQLRRGKQFGTLTKFQFSRNVGPATWRHYFSVQSRPDVRLVCPLAHLLAKAQLPMECRTGHCTIREDYQTSAAATVCVRLVPL